MVTLSLVLIAAAALRLLLYARQARCLRAEPPGESVTRARGLARWYAARGLWQVVTAALLIFLAVPMLFRNSAPAAPVAVFVMLLAWLLDEIPEALRPSGPPATWQISLNRWLTRSALCAPVCAAAPWVMAQRTYAAWWLIAFTGIAAAWVYRELYWSVLRPQLEPRIALARDELRLRLDRLARRYRLAGVAWQEAKGPGAEPIANARAEAAWALPRVVLWPRLLSLLEADEVEAVVAHELAHLRLHHLSRQFAHQCAVWLISATVALALGMAAAKTPQAVLQTALAAALLPLLLGLGQSWLMRIYRQYEFEADELAAKHVDGTALARALEKLTAQQPRSPAADEWHRAIYDSHPPLQRRLEALRTRP
jgi:STE24 endopeptidase